MSEILPNNYKRILKISIQFLTEKSGLNIWRNKNKAILLHQKHNCNDYKIEMKISAFDYLTQQGIKPSVQRLAVMDYLMRYRSHPSADEIYNALVESIPTLSKTTVYNTLKLFVEQGAAIMLTIDERNTKFDADTTPHAHFFCRRCTRVYDLPVEAKKLLQSTELPEGFKGEETALYVKGVCKACQQS